MLHISQQDLDVLAGIDEDPDAMDPKESDEDNEGVELNLPVAQDPQGQFTHVDNQDDDTAPEIPDQDDTMGSTGREDDGVVAGGINVPKGGPPTPHRQ